MPNIEVDEMSQDSSIGGTEEIIVYDSADGMVHITPTQIKDWIIDQVEAISTASDTDDSDSIMILQNDSVLKPVTMELFRQHIADVLWGKTAETSVDDDDDMLLKDGGSTEKTVGVDVLATYMLAELEPDILDISDKASKSTPVAADLFLNCDGTTPKKTTYSELRSAILGYFETYIGNLSAVTTTNDADVLYCTQSGTEKKITLGDILAHAGYTLNGSGSANTLANWSDSDTLTNTYSTTDSFSAGDNTTIPTTKGVRDEINELVNDGVDIGVALADGDDIVVYDTSDNAQYKSDISRLWTYIWGKIKALTAKTTPVDADILTVQDSAASNAGKEVTVGNLWDNRYLTDAKAIKLDDFTAPDDTTDLDASTSSHGLCPKGDNDATHFLAGDLSWSAPTITNSNMSNAVLKVDTVSVSSTEIKALNTSGEDLVNAPGANKVIEFISAALFLDYGTTDYDTNGNLKIQTGTTNTVVSDTIAQGDFLFNSADSYRVVQALSADTQLDVDEGLQLFCETGDPANGDSTMTVKVTYRIHDFS